ncbi:HpcH/HpaI aldolase family protein [Halorarius halobius]|uniref:HpcH/HpaI aldolase family protein n=1 Tax=Halorarius halobius TaxID=2962671 RepID=UPI0020CF2CEF|nr:aldolase/citrate lyase family protein [Halorarius halobius]
MFHERLRAGDPLVGGWVSLSDPAVAEVAAPEFDFLMLDTEHAPNGTETIANQVRAVEAAPGEAVPLARALDNDVGAIKRLLDLGVAGVMVPMVESAAEAREAARAANYPPEGDRGVAAARASDYGRDLDGYFETANERTVLLVQIETEAGLENVEEIAAVDGVDALFVGPADLSANLGCFRQFDDERFAEAVDRILAAGAAADTPVGTLGGTPEALERFGSMGFDYLIAGVDFLHLQRGNREVRDAADDQLED